MQLFSTQYVLGLLLVVCLLVLLQLWATRLFRHRWTRPSRTRASAVNLALCFLTVAWFLLFLELVFAFFHVESDFYGFTLAARKWHRKYWKPINSLGFRDVEHDPKVLQEKRVVFVVGDSLAAGYGIDDFQDRFPNRLGEMLGEEWEVVILTLSGWDSEQEYRALENYSRVAIPETIVLSYYINDNIHAFEDLGYEEPQAVVRPQGLRKKVIEASHLFNFVCWRTYRLVHRDVGDKYWAYIREVSADPQVWDIHRRQLCKFIEFAERCHARLVVVVFPHLAGVEWSRSLTQPVVDLFQSEGVEVLDLTPVFEGRDPKELVVSSIDPHPNERVHEEVAALLFEALMGDSPAADGS